MIYIQLKCIYSSASTLLTTAAVMAIILATNKAQVTCYGYWPGLALIQKHSLLHNIHDHTKFGAFIKFQHQIFAGTGSETPLIMRWKAAAEHTILTATALIFDWPSQCRSVQMLKTSCSQPSFIEPYDRVRPDTHLHWHFNSCLESPNEYSRPELIGLPNPMWMDHVFEFGRPNRLCSGAQTMFCFNQTE